MNKQEVLEFLKNNPVSHVATIEDGVPRVRALRTFPGSHRFLANAVSMGDWLEAMVARRGTTLHIGGPSDATLVISGAGLTDLTPYTERDLYGGGWNISLPQLGTVGTYTATLTAGTWHEEMPIYVIFEVPADHGSCGIADREVQVRATDLHCAG